ncbi:hypothetical protein DFJ73DRAFT_793253 [Zopfochytrium polystomum]|nr:hypothetical protein DFJ73DRAFT_793253 [Zopfochytrium polystomum]
MDSSNPLFSLADLAVAAAEAAAATLVLPSASVPAAPATAPEPLRAAAPPTAAPRAPATMPSGNAPIPHDLPAAHVPPSLSGQPQPPPLPPPQPAQPPSPSATASSLATSSPVQQTGQPLMQELSPPPGSVLAAPDSFAGSPDEARSHFPPAPISTGPQQPNSPRGGHSSPAQKRPAPVNSGQQDPPAKRSRHEHPNGVKDSSTASSGAETLFNNEEGRGQQGETTPIVQPARHDRQRATIEDPTTLDRISHIIRTQFDFEILLKRREIQSIRDEISKGEDAMNLIRSAVASLAASSSPATQAGAGTGPGDGGAFAGNAQAVGSRTRRSTGAAGGRQSGAHSASAIVTTLAPTTVTLESGTAGPPARALASQSSGTANDAARAVAAAPPVEAIPALPPHLETPVGRRSGSNGKDLFAQREDGVTVKVICPSCRRSDFASLQGFINHCRNKHQIELTGHLQAVRMCGVEVAPGVTEAKETARLNSLVPKAFDRPAGPVVRESDLNSVNSKIRPKRIARINVYEPSGDIDIGDEDAAVPAEQIILSPDPVSPTAKPDSTAHADDLGEEKAMGSRDEDVEMHSAVAADGAGSSNSSSASPANALFTGGIAIRPGAEGSRFYITRRILVGNVSRYIPEEKRGFDKYQYKWMLFLRCPPTDPDISTFVDRIVIFLHRDYAPNDVVGVTAPPFHLTRYGWGEFTIRIRLYFVDKERNRPKDLIYALKLDRLQLGTQVLGGEEWFDIELDRNTVFGPPRAPSAAPPPPPPSATSGKKGGGKGKVARTKSSSNIVSGLSQGAVAKPETRAEAQASGSSSATEPKDAGSTLVPYCWACGGPWHVEGETDAAPLTCPVLTKHGFGATRTAELAVADGDSSGQPASTSAAAPAAIPSVSTLSRPNPILAALRAVPPLPALSAHFPPNKGSSAWDVAAAGPRTWMRGCANPNGVAWVLAEASRVGVAVPGALDVVRIGQHADGGSSGVNGDGLVVAAREVVGGLLFEATKLFLSKLLKRAETALREDAQLPRAPAASAATTSSATHSKSMLPSPPPPPPDSQPTEGSAADAVSTSNEAAPSKPTDGGGSISDRYTGLLVPLHVHRAATSDPRFDFLTGCYVGSCAAAPAGATAGARLARSGGGEGGGPNSGLPAAPAPAAGMVPDAARAKDAPSQVRRP